MSSYPRNSIPAAIVCFALFALSGADARTRKGDRLLMEAQAAETRGDWARALTLSQQAIAADPADPAYGLEVRRVRFQAAAFYISDGQRLRARSKLQDALIEFQNAHEVDPSSDIADQEIRRTEEMLEREKAHPSETGASITPVERAEREARRRIGDLLPAAELTPFNTQPIILRMSNQKPCVLFETLGKLAGVNVLFDPDYMGAVTKSQSIDLQGSSLADAFDALAVITHSFWKPFSANTIFVTQDTPAKRKEYENEEMKVFYLSNVTSSQELQEVITALRQVIEVSKLFIYSSQNALVVRAEPDRMALVEKMVADLDKPRSEVLVDVTVMEADSTHARQLAAAFAPNGISSTIEFSPRSAIQTLASSLTSSASSSTSSSATSSTTSSTVAMPLANLSKIGGQDFSLTNVPGGLIEAIMSDVGTRVLQEPQIRAVDNMKATLKIGDRVPTASGSFSAGSGTTAVSALVNTQFTYIDTGVNLEITPRVHDNNEISMHVDIDVSQVSSYVDLGGISEPVISQRKATVDVRMRDGQINVIGGLLQLTDSKNVSGVPGLASIPVLNRLFTSQQLQRDKTELLISIVPHIVRGPDITPENLAAVQTGNAANFKIRRASPDPLPLP